MTRQTLRKLALAVGVLALAAIFFGLGLHRYLTLEYIKSSQQTFQTLYASHTAAVLAAYFFGYIAMVALNLPGALVASLAGAALLGFWPALLVVSFASSIGATLACLLARYLFRDVVRNRFSHLLDRVDKGIAEEGAFYLFTMRLIPAIPFFAINLVMGLTKMRLVTFYWVSQLGMLPGTVVYLNAGAQLGQLESLSGILSPGILASFALLGIFPLATKKIMGMVKKKQTDA
ncbi:MAG: TVP38/TMEM64 family protein [Desulfovibrio sp.]|uniref:TVP38/TMEM64 family protein n=1 Tax=Desulfovibrio sp. 7SRBS1 TaxID=3378064 RepID=UPI003B3D7968